MTLTRSGLLVVALAFAMTPACRDRSTEPQAIAPQDQAPPPAAEPQATGTSHTSLTTRRERVPLATGRERVPLETAQDSPAAPALRNAEVTVVHQGDEALPSSDASIQAPEALPKNRQSAPTEAEVRRAIDQIQARMNDELARARNIIVELQKANAELRQTLAAERQLIAELHKRLISGRSIALQ